MARLTKEQRRELANIRDGDESDIVAATRDLAACILRLNEEVASEDGQCTGHEATISRLSDDLRDERAARANLFSALSRVEAARDEARTMLGQLQSAFSAAVNVVVKTGHHRTTPVLAEAVSLIVAERDEALAVRANQEATIVDLGEALASAIDERDELRDVRDELWAKLENACSERDGARAKLSDVDRLLAIEEQAKRVVRAEKWLRWARTADAETDDWHGAVVSAADTLRAERRKLAEMVGEGDET